MNGIAIFGEGAGGLPASVGKVVRVNYESVLDVGGVFAYDYGTNTPRDLILQNPGGNVGIGTSTPSDKLEVSGGNIRVTGGSFIDDGTTLNTPDYVFEEDYALMSLDELRAFISREKHLPSVPSAEDIKKDGLNLSQFQMILLEKIEELTLYTLAQQEQIEALKMRMKELKGQLSN